MDDQLIVLATTAVLVIYFLAHVASRKFDPFRPGLAVSSRVCSGLRDPGTFLSRMGSGGSRQGSGTGCQSPSPLGAFVVPCLLPPGSRPGHRRRAAAAAAPVEPALDRRACTTACDLGPLLRRHDDPGGGLEAEPTSPEEALLRSFPFVMMVAAIMLIVTGRSLSVSRPRFLPAGITVAVAYAAIWMFNGKRSHSLIGVLSTVCAFYITRMKRPSWPVLGGNARSPVLWSWHRDRLAGERCLRAVALRVHPVSFRVQARKDPREPEHRGGGRTCRRPRATRRSSTAASC